MQSVFIVGGVKFEFIFAFSRTKGFHGKCWSASLGCHSAQLYLRFVYVAFTLQVTSPLHAAASCTESWVQLCGTQYIKRFNALYMDLIKTQIHNALNLLDIELNIY
jgi:hypothetical protein